MAEVEGYKVAPLRLTAKAQNCHSIYMREHFIRLMDPNKPKGRTLFLLNIPPYVTEESLRTCFAKVGKVASVTFAAKPGKEETEKWQQKQETDFAYVRPPFQFKVGYVVFELSSSIAKALALESIDLYRCGTGECIIESGLQLWHNNYQRYILDVNDTQARIDAYMAEYDERERAAQEAARNEKTDDGWTVVGSQGRDAGMELKKSNVEKLEMKTKKELKNFYTFQIRESKMKNVIELRKKFEEDKRKIEMVKQTRRFRPF